MGFKVYVFFLQRCEMRCPQRSSTQLPRSCSRGSPWAVLGAGGSLVGAPGLHQPLPWFTPGVSRFFPIPQPWRCVCPVTTQLHHTGSDPVWTQLRRLPSRGAWAGPGAEAVQAVGMQGWQLTGGRGSPHSFYFCCLCHMDATTDDVIRLVPPGYFCIDLWVCVLSPSPHQGSCRALGCTCPPCAGGFGGCFLQAPPAPQG